MGKFICELNGVRGRKMWLFDTKCIIKTEVTAGSLLTGNSTDGEKTIFFADVVGVQFKESRYTIGYLQFETPSMQMNNQASNMFSENTFTFEQGKNGITNEMMHVIYRYVTDRLEELKYGSNPTQSKVPIPQFGAPVPPQNAQPQYTPPQNAQPQYTPPQNMQPQYVPPQNAQSEYTQQLYQQPNPAHAGPPKVPHVNWICGHCGASNPDTRRDCSACHKPRF